MTLRVAAVEYLNARPLYEALDPDAFSLELALPSEVARKLAEDECDVALIPVAAAASIGDLVFLPGSAIGAFGAVGSVVIVSHEPVETVREIAVDLSSRTSAVLARLIVEHRLGRKPKWIGLPASEAIDFVGEGRAALIIGDRALLSREKYPHVIDLAAAWTDWTGLPFVFAAWASKAHVVSTRENELIVKAMNEGLERRQAIAHGWATERGLAEEPYVAYLHENIRYTFGDREQQGLQRFFDEAARAKLLPPTKVVLADEKVAAVESIDAILARAEQGGRLSVRDGLRLFHEASLFDLALASDAVRRRKHPKQVVTYIVDRNVNYTNVCTTSCRFCAFYRPIGHAEGYVLSREQLRPKLQEVVFAGGVQILLQGGLNPELRIGWYEELFAWIKAEFGLGLHALSPEEILHIAKMENLPVETVLLRLHKAGLDSVPGGGAEILIDRVRRKIAKAKCTSDEWLFVMRKAHQMGLRSSCTMMYGTVDSERDRILHLVKLRDLQDETSGFTAFFCWDFQHEQGTTIEPGDGGTTLYLRQQAIARLMLDNVEHVGASWVTQGPDIGQVALRFGADDFGSVMFEENVVSSAGTTFRMNAHAMEDRIHRAGFQAVRRNVAYEWLSEPS